MEQNDKVDLMWGVSPLPFVFSFFFFMGRPQTHLKNTVKVTSFSVDIERKAASAGTLGRHANSNLWGFAGSL